MAPRSSRSRVSLLLVVILLCALAVGAATSLITSARTEGPPPPAGPVSEVILPGWVVGAAILGFLVAVIAPLLYYRIRYAPPGVPGQFTIVAVSLLLAMVIFTVLARLIASSSGGFTATSNGSANNSSQGSPPGSNGTLPPATGPGGVLAPLNLHLPSWTLFVVVAIAVVGVAVAGMPRLAEYLEERREARRARSRAGQVSVRVQTALRQAARALGSGEDPRATILALYAQLLARIEPLVKDLERETPEEIRLHHLTRLGIRPGAAEDLTRVFEEARYSSHPLGTEAVDRASAAIRAAEADLARRVDPT
jgi:hypothetical protein